jgi:hypothetical protein
MDSRTWQQPQPRGSVYAEKTTWLLVAAFALLLAGLMVNQSTTAFFTDTRVVSGNNFITASVALNETPFTAFNFEKFVPGDVFVRPVTVTNSTASNSGAINVNYYMTVKDNFSTCSTQDPKCTDAKGTLSDVTNGLRLVAIRCFSDTKGTENVACESSSLRSVRLVKGVMETIWPSGATNATTDIAGIVRDRNETVQYGNVAGTGSEALSAFPGLPNSGDASDYFGRPIVFAKAGALSTQPISVKINPRRSDTNNPAQLGTGALTNTVNPVVQGSDVLRIGGTVQDLDGNWARAAMATGAAAASGAQACGNTRVSAYATSPALDGCGAEVVGVPIQTLSNPNCNGLATTAANRAVVNATGNQGSQAGPGANPTVISVNQAALAPQVFSSQSQGACFMGGSEFEKNAPIVLSPRINNQLMAAGAGETPRILSDIPAQSLFDQANTIAGLGAGKSDQLALIVYLPSWATQSTQDEVAATSLTVQSRQTLDAQNNPVSVPTGGVGNKTGGRASYTVAFTAVQPVGQTFALANVAQQSVNTLQALAGQINTNSAAFQAQSTDVGVAGAALISGGIQTLSPNSLPGLSTQVVSVTGRGFAKVTGVPQNVKAEASLSGGTLASATYRYRVTAVISRDSNGAVTPTTFAVTSNKDWNQGEPSTEVTAETSGTSGQVTVTWNLVPGATHYNVYRNVVDNNGYDQTYSKRFQIEATDSATRSVPGSTGFKAGAQFGIVDTGTNGTADTGKYPAVGRPCVAYASPSFFGMCPKIEIFASGPIPVTGGTATTSFTVKTGEVVRGSAGTPRSGATTDYSPAGISGASEDLLQSADNLTDARIGRYKDTADTVGFLSSNQVTFQATPKVVSSLTRYGVRITNPQHESLPLDVRAKVMTFQDSITVIPQAIAKYTPPVIGKLSSGNTLVIEGSGFQKGAIVQLGFYGTDTGGNPVRATAALTNGVSTNFVSRSHIVNRTAESVTSNKLGTWYATRSGSLDATTVQQGFNGDITDAQVSAARDGASLSTDGTVANDKEFDPATGLVVKEFGSVGVGKSQVAVPPGTANPYLRVPFFSYDHTKVEVNTDSKITIKDLTVTNAFNIADASGTVAAKVFNPDGSVVEGATFNIAAPGIEQIVQHDTATYPAKAWLSAAQGQTVKLHFKGVASNTDFKGPARDSKFAQPTMTITCYAKATAADVTAGKKKADGSAAVAGSEFDPCLNPLTGARDVGITQVGNLRVITSSSITAANPFGSTPDNGQGNIVEGDFVISPTAVVSLRRFTMVNGDAAVFSNYFSISQAPTFTRATYTSGTNRIVADTVAAIGTGGFGGSILSSDKNANFNVEGRLPRGATRRVLISGTGFVRGSFAPMADPNVAGSVDAVTQTTQATAACSGLSADNPGASGGANGSCFGQRSNNSLVSALVSVTTTPRITFSNSGVSLAGDADKDGFSDLTTVVPDAATDLSMATTTTQSAVVEHPFLATNRLTAVVQVAPGAIAGPVTMTITNPDGGKVIVPNAFIVDGVPTVNVTRDAAITASESSAVSAATGVPAGIVRTSTATIKQGEAKAGTTNIYIYGSGFFGSPQVSVSGTGVRVTKVTLGVAPVSNPGTNDAEMYDTVMRVEVTAESTAPTGTRDITIVLPDGQSVTTTGALTVNAP